MNLLAHPHEHVPAVVVGLRVNHSVNVSYSSVKIDKIIAAIFQFSC